MIAIANILSLTDHVTIKTIHPSFVDIFGCWVRYSAPSLKHPWGAQGSLLQGREKRRMTSLPKEGRAEGGESL